MAWKELLKKPYLSQKPQLTQGLATYAEDRDLELAFKNLRDLEDHCKKLYKEVRRHEECANGLHRLEKKMSSDITNSPLCREYEDAEDLRKMAEDYQVHTGTCKESGTRNLGCIKIWLTIMVSRKVKFFSPIFSAVILMTKLRFENS